MNATGVAAPLLFDDIRRLLVATQTFFRSRRMLTDYVCQNRCEFHLFQEHVQSVLDDKSVQCIGEAVIFTTSAEHIDLDCILDDIGRADNTTCSK